MNISLLTRKTSKAVPFYLLLAALFIFLLFPFYWGAITSFKFQTALYDFSGNFLWIKNPSLSNYVTLFMTPNFFKWFWNTFTISALTSLISVVISVMAGRMADPPPPPLTAVASVSATASGEGDAC